MQEAVRKWQVDPLGSTEFHVLHTLMDPDGTNRAWQLVTRNLREACKRHDDIVLEIAAMSMAERYYTNVSEYANLTFEALQLARSKRDSAVMSLLAVVAHEMGDSSATGDSGLETPLASAVNWPKTIAAVVSTGRAMVGLGTGAISSGLSAGASAVASGVSAGAGAVATAYEASGLARAVVASQSVVRHAIVAMGVYYKVLHEDQRMSVRDAIGGAADAIGNTTQSALAYLTSGPSLETSLRRQWGHFLLSDEQEAAATEEMARLRAELEGQTREYNSATSRNASDSQIKEIVKAMSNTEGQLKTVRDALSNHHLAWKKINQMAARGRVSVEEVIARLGIKLNAPSQAAQVDAAATERALATTAAEGASQAQTLAKGLSLQIADASDLVDVELDGKAIATIESPFTNVTATLPRLAFRPEYSALETNGTSVTAAAVTAVAVAATTGSSTSVMPTAALPTTAMDPTVFMQVPDLEADMREIDALVDARVKEAEKWLGAKVQDETVTSSTTGGAAIAVRESYLDLDFLPSFESVLTAFSTLLHARRLAKAATDVDNAAQKMQLWVAQNKTLQAWRTKVATRLGINIDGSETPQKTETLIARALMTPVRFARRVASVGSYMVRNPLTRWLATQNESFWKLMDLVVLEAMLIARYAPEGAEPMQAMILGALVTVASSKAMEKAPAKVAAAATGVFDLLTNTSLRAATVWYAESNQTGSSYAFMQQIAVSMLFVDMWTRSKRVVAPAPAETQTTAVETKSTTRNGDDDDAKRHVLTRLRRAFAGVGVDEAKTVQELVRKAVKNKIHVFEVPTLREPPADATGFMPLLDDPLSPLSNVIWIIDSKRTVVQTADGNVATSVLLRVGNGRASILVRDPDCYILPTAARFRGDGWSDIKAPSAGDAKALPAAEFVYGTIDPRRRRLKRNKKEREQILFTPIANVSLVNMCETDKIVQITSSSGESTLAALICLDARDTRLDNWMKIPVQEDKLMHTSVDAFAARLADALDRLGIPFKAMFAAFFN